MSLRTPPSPPSLPVPRRLQDPETERFRSDAHAFFTQVARTLLPWGNMVTVTLTAGTPARVRHGLARPPRGYINVGATAAGNVYDASGSPTSDDTVWLQTNTSGTYRLWFF